MDTGLISIKEVNPVTKSGCGACSKRCQGRVGCQLLIGVESCTCGEYVDHVIGNIYTGVGADQQTRFSNS
jgi:hypothetical protein